MSLITSSSLVAVILLAATPSFADQTVSPNDGHSWGDDNSAQNMLNMTRDPQIVRDQEETRVRNQRIGSSCTDTNGHVFDEEDPGYARCRRDLKTAASSATQPAPAKPGTAKK